MTRTEYWYFHIANSLVILTGLVYGWMIYFMEPVDPFAVVNHVWQPHLHHAHLWVAPLLVFMLGMMGSLHARPYVKRGIKEGRRSGWTLIALALPMILSGYFLQTAVAELWRTLWVFLHISTSIIWCVASAFHVGIHWWLRWKRSVNV